MNTGHAKMAEWSMGALKDISHEMIAEIKKYYFMQPVSIITGIIYRKTQNTNYNNLR